MSNIIKAGEFKLLDASGGRYSKKVERFFDSIHVSVYETRTDRKIDVDYFNIFPWRDANKTFEMAHAWADKIIEECEQYETIPRSKQ